MRRWGVAGRSLTDQRISVGEESKFHKSVVFLYVANESFARSRDPNLPKIACLRIPSLTRAPDDKG